MGTSSVNMQFSIAKGDTRAIGMLINHPEIENAQVPWFSAWLGLDGGA